MGELASTRDPPRVLQLANWRKARMPHRPLRRMAIRVTLHQASVEDEELRLRARSDDADANQRPLAKLKETAQSAETPSADMGAKWDHGSARDWLLRTEVGAGAFAYKEVHLVDPCDVRCC